MSAKETIKALFTCYWGIVDGPYVCSMICVNLKNGAGSKIVETFADTEGQYPVETFHYYAGHGNQPEGVSFFDPTDGFVKVSFQSHPWCRQKIGRHEPLEGGDGTTPFNVPLMLFAPKAALALATRNMFVCKPSERNCLSTIYIGKLFTQASFPLGVMNIVVGDRKIGDVLAEHPDVNKISFTGTVTTGVKINVVAAKTLKGVTLELSGKSPFIVFRDCDREIVVL